MSQKTTKLIQYTAVDPAVKLLEKFGDAIIATVQLPFRSTLDRIKAEQEFEAHLDRVAEYERQQAVRLQELRNANQKQFYSYLDTKNVKNGAGGKFTAKN